MQGTKLLSAASGRRQFLAVGHESSPYLSVYPWDSLTGFGTKYSDPASALTSQVNGVAFSPSGYDVVVSMLYSPYIAAYQWSASGFGTRYSNPSDLPGGYGQRVSFSPGADYVVTCTDPLNSFGPFISVYPWSSSGFGSQVADPVTLVAGTNQADFHPSGNAIVFVGSSSNPSTILAYPWSGVFGVAFSNPTSSFSGIGNGVKFTRDGQAVIAVHAGSPYISAWKWSGSGFGTKYAAPSLLPNNTGTGISVTGGSDYVAMTTSTSPGNYVYPWSYAGGFGTRVSTSSLTSSQKDVAFSVNNDAIAFAGGASGAIKAFQWSGGAYGSQYSNPATLPSGVPTSVTFGALG